MKKILLLITMPFAFFSVLTAQITQEQADAIVLEHMNGETRPYAVYAQPDVQPAGTNIIPAGGETIELEYACWIYYIRYADQPDNVAASHHYLVVKKEDGNLLEVRTRNNPFPYYITAWRPVPIYSIGIPLVNIPWPDSECEWLVAFTASMGTPLLFVNSQEEFTKLFTCGDKLPEVDFENYSVIIVYSGENFGEIDETYHLTKTGENQYLMKADNIKSIMALVPKIPGNITIYLNSTD